MVHQVLLGALGAFVEHAEQQGRPLPSFVQREVEAHLRCWMLEHGLLRLGCPSCGFERLVAFSCRKRGFCLPMCLGRRMTDTACQLRDRVLPAMPLRQWMLSLPWELRMWRLQRGRCARPPPKRRSKSPTFEQRTTRNPSSRRAEERSRGSAGCARRRLVPSSRLTG